MELSCTREQKISGNFSYLVVQYNYSETGRRILLMNSWNDGIRNAIHYIEEHLAEDIDINELASKAFVSSCYSNHI